MSLQLAKLSARDAKTALSSRVLVIPLGSTEQHGPHLPLATDTTITSKITQSLIDLRPDQAIIAPMIPFGCSGEHSMIPGTLSVSAQALEFYLVELVRSSEANQAIAIVSAHGGNAVPLLNAHRILQSEGRKIMAWIPTVDALISAAERHQAPLSFRGLWQPDLHAGRTETSIMLALDPSSVNLQAASAGALEDPAKLIEMMKVGGIGAVSKNGVIGDPAGASVEEGLLILSAFAEDLLTKFDKFYQKVSF